MSCLSKNGERGAEIWLDNQLREEVNPQPPLITLDCDLYAPPTHLSRYWHGTYSSSTGMRGDVSNSRKGSTGDRGPGLG